LKTRKLGWYLDPSVPSLKKKLHKCPKEARAPPTGRNQIEDHEDFGLSRRVKSVGTRPPPPAYTCRALGARLVYLSTSRQSGNEQMLG